MAIQTIEQHQPPTGLPRSRWSLAITGWCALLICFTLGAVMALAFAPFYFWPVLFISVGGFYAMLENTASRRQAMLRGFFFGYGYFMAGTWWIANALTVDLNKFGWMIPLCVLGLSAVLALWFALFGFLMHCFRQSRLLPDFIFFPALWIAVEYLRSYGMFGFPWNLVGYTALASLEVAQLASLIGTFGLGLVVVMAALGPLLAWRSVTRRARFCYVAISLLLIAASYGYGAARLAQTSESTATSVRVVQPNIPQAVKSTAEGNQLALRVLTELSATPRPVDVTVWSETAFPGVLRSPQTGFAWPYSKQLITGAVRVEREAGNIRVFNSVVALDSNGDVTRWYDKHQLVPFGEFVPLRSILPLDKITPGNLDFSRGVGPQTLTIGALPTVSPLVCYEAIFPWMAADPAHRPDWLVNVTNDAWYGNSPGPYQHFAMARMRAIEQGLPLVRVANNGISAVIDPYGRVVASLPLATRGAFDAFLPAAIAPTLYAGYGELPTLIVLLSLIGFAIARFLLTKNK